MAEHFQWIESLSRLKIAQRLNEQRPAHMSAINALVEINIDDEESKSGIAPEALSDFLASVSLLPNIQLRGLMCIPKADADETEKRQTFARMKKIFEDCRAKGYAFDTLSMGMSADYEVAIEEGSTLVRVGSAIFGARNYSKS